MTQDFDYSTFDRHIQHLINMSQQVVEDWNDLSTSELSCDLYSLNTKAARVCSWVDVDLARQQNDLTKARSSKNIIFCNQLNELVYLQLIPLLSSITKELQAHRLPPHPKHPDFSTSLNTMMQRLIPILPQNEAQEEGWDTLQVQAQKLENLYQDKVKMSKAPDIKPEERIKLLLQFFILMCYLLFHFQRMTQLTDEQLSEEEAGRLLLATVQNYCDSEEGKTELQRYHTALLFDNDSQPLTHTQIKEARKALRKEVPNHLQLSFMQHIDQPGRLSLAALEAQPSKQDINLLVVAIAKWQMLTTDLYQLEHPKQAEPELPNEIFVTTRHGSHVNLHKLRKQLLDVLTLITRKNHWFCLWCVLRHRNLLQTDNFEAFARQMQMQEWLGADIREELRFGGDTLRVYSGYLSATDYTRWDFTSFDIERTRQNKISKWNNKLYNTFQHLCYSIDEVISN